MYICPCLISHFAGSLFKAFLFVQDLEVKKTFCASPSPEARAMFRSYCGDTLPFSHKNFTLTT